MTSRCHLKLLVGRQYSVLVKSLNAHDQLGTPKRKPVSTTGVPPRRPRPQKRVLDYSERRISALFDTLDWETLLDSVVDQLLTSAKAMDVHSRAATLAIHVDLLTCESRARWMSGITQLHPTGL
ncbi:hypothetical protein F5887DRAFT_77033 [Amanita rubescens]|nr:hypothetical protein F5887DRAFT_77033 [Amanita rubescens]